MILIDTEGKTEGRFHFFPFHNDMSAYNVLGFQKDIQEYEFLIHPVCV